MKSYSAPAMAAIEAGEAIVTGAVEIASDPPIRVWGGYEPIELDGPTYHGIGDRGIAQRTAGALGGAAQGLTLELSGIEPDVLALLDAAEVKDAAVVVRRLIFGKDGRTLLDHHVSDRGRLDQLTSVATIGGRAAVRALVETAARGLGRRGGRMRSDSDQRLINPVDGYFKNTAFAAEKMLYWGGKRAARAGSVLGGGAGGSGSGGGRGDPSWHVALD